MAGPYDLLTRDPVPDTIQVWALTALPSGPSSLADVKMRMIAGSPIGAVVWGGLQTVIAGVQALRPYQLRLGPLPPGIEVQPVGGLAVVDTGGQGQLLDLVEMPAQLWLPEYPAYLSLGLNAILVFGGT